MEHLGKILPIDGYQVLSQGSLPTDYVQSLTHLYQPLLGIEAISLFQVLLHEINVQPEVHLQTHHTLMNYLSMPLDQIYKARLKLEGIGLLKTYKQKTEDKTYYTYVLQTPFSPEAFFQDIMLSELLYRHIGKTKFNTLKKHYTKTKDVKGENITAAFHQVFQTFEPENQHITPIHKEKPQRIPIEKIDFLFLEQSLKRKMIPVEKVLTEPNKRAISQLTHLYNLESYEIEKAVEWALTDENKIDIEQLKVVCHDIFQSKQNVNQFRLTFKEPDHEKVTDKKSLTKLEKLQQKFETISPKELLEDLSTGNNASEQDMKFISELMISQGLPAPVMNVLIHYVMLRSDMKLPREYTETIASNWSRKKFKTAKEAMDFVQKQSQAQPKPRRSYQPRRQSKEVIPDWFKERQKQRGNSDAEEVELMKEQKREQEEMTALLQKYASKNN